MKDQLLKELASKFGTTVEHLWSVLVKQAPIDSICECVALIVLWLVYAIILRWHLRRLKSDDRDTDCDNLFHLIVFVIFVAFICGTVIEAPTIFAGFFNPEFWALKQIIK